MASVLGCTSPGSTRGTARYHDALAEPYDRRHWAAALPRARRARAAGAAQRGNSVAAAPRAAHGRVNDRRPGCWRRSTRWPRSSGPRRR
ncbi:hypothetical protein HBB16_15245 [Pseudonocardia sp. MCCB 268]|nr:hypothetical protein [Pseudonocardia cytotoxica]